MEKNMKDVLARVFLLLDVKGIVTSEELEVCKQKGLDYLCEMLDEKVRDHVELLAKEIEDKLSKLQ